MKFRFAKDVELMETDGNAILLAKTPLCLLRLNRSLAALLQAVRDDTPWQASENKITLLRKIAEMGFLELCCDETRRPPPWSSVSVVIPVKDRAAELRRCLASLSSLRYPPANLEVIVVDDGSSDNCPEIAANWGARLLFSGGTGLGPSVARNVGAAAAGGEILAFIDSDCTASAEWLSQLIPVFGDPLVAAVGGKVEGLHTASMLDRYEAVMSSLSLGTRQVSAGKGEDTLYLPGCNLLVRRNVFLRLGGFRRAMQVGEDVDLSYRIRDDGRRIVYLPTGIIHHEHRNRYASFMARRFDYGTSEEMLQRHHPLRKKRMPVPPLLAALLFLCLTVPLTGGWGVLTALTVLLVDGGITRIKIQRLGARIGFITLLAGRLRALGSLLYYLCAHLIRYYAVPLLLLCFLVPPLRSVGIAVLLCTTVVDYAVKKPKLFFLSFVYIYLLEQIAYGFGVLWGCLRHMNFASYRVVMLKRIATYLD